MLSLNESLDRLEAERAVKREALRAALYKTLAESDLSEQEKSSVLYGMSMEAAHRWAGGNGSVTMRLT